MTRSVCACVCVCVYNLCVLLFLTIKIVKNDGHTTTTAKSLACGPDEQLNNIISYDIQVLWIEPFRGAFLYYIYIFFSCGLCEKPSMAPECKRIIVVIIGDHCVGILLYKVIRDEAQVFACENEKFCGSIWRVLYRFSKLNLRSCRGKGPGDTANTYPRSSENPFCPVRRFALFILYNTGFYFCLNGTVNLDNRRFIYYFLSFFCQLNVYDENAVHVIPPVLMYYYGLRTRRERVWSLPYRDRVKVQVARKNRTKVSNSSEGRVWSREKGHNNFPFIFGFFFF